MQIFRVSKSVVIGILALLAVVAGSVYLRQSARDAVVPVDSTVSARGADDAPADIGSPSTPRAIGAAAAAGGRARMSTEPLPSLETPLRTTVRDLAARAEAGDARAMCRLAAEYQYCAGLETRMQMLERGAERAQARPNGGAGRGVRSAEGIAAAFESVSERYQHCDGVAIPAAAEIVRYMRGAAVAGHPQATGYYASGDIFRNQDTLQNLAELGFYRDNAEAMARSAMANGDLRAAWSLADAYGADAGSDFRRSLLAQAVEPAPDKALSLYYGLRNVIGAGADDPATARMAARLQERIAALEKRLPQAEVARARGEPSIIGADAGVDALIDSAFSRGRDGVGGFPRERCE